MLVHPEAMSVGALADKIRKIENWPQKGILFHDITPVLQSAEYFRLLVDLLVYRYMDQKIDIVAGFGRARLHYRRGTRLPAQRRFRPHPQKRQAAF